MWQGSRQTSRQRGAGRNMWPLWCSPPIPARAPLPRKEGACAGLERPVGLPWLSKWDLPPPSGMGGCRNCALWHCESVYKKSGRAWLRGHQETDTLIYLRSVPWCRNTPQARGGGRGGCIVFFAFLRLGSTSLHCVFVPLGAIGLGLSPQWMVGPQIHARRCGESRQRGRLKLVKVDFGGRPVVPD